VPGVNLVDDQLSIRGSSGYSRGAGARVLMAIDGLPFYTGDTGEIIWEAVPVNEIETVEIIKGASSSLYGIYCHRRRDKRNVRRKLHQPFTYVKLLYRGL
jgi:outer membrane cobalamin receptor